MNCARNVRNSPSEKPKESNKGLQFWNISCVQMKVIDRLIRFLRYQTLHNALFRSSEGAPETGERPVRKPKNCGF